ncbi:hypothetical protein [Thermoactinospora rubra]|uniref:hypothetical protein n=1 Tax=Thermoactinospora rubra TaxID=1088767 RepID=UPI000A10677D|nr:hypothetical protein [Thermoactinospora rubra]
MPSLAINTTGLILLTILVTALIIAVIIGAVRFTQHPRNHLTPNPDVLDQARELKANGQIQDAVFLVRGETGMSHRAAVRFVRRL